MTVFGYYVIQRPRSNAFVMSVLQRRSWLRRGRMHAKVQKTSCEDNMCLMVGYEVVWCEHTCYRPRDYLAEAPLEKSAIN